MGITIHYRGQLDDTGTLPSLVGEMTDIGRSMGWACQVLDDDWDAEPDALKVVKTGASLPR